MELEWITPGQAAERWRITERQVQSLCSQGKVANAVRIGRVWLIPRDTSKPLDGRTKAAKHVKNKEYAYENQSAPETVR
jgi:hypothetical protein